MKQVQTQSFFCDHIFQYSTEYKKFLSESYINLYSLEILKMQTIKTLTVSEEPKMCIGLHL